MEGVMSRFKSLAMLSFAVLSAVGFVESLPRANAQVLYGAIVGTVTDQAGASVPGAKVRAMSVGTSQSRETETDGAGTYAFPSIVGDTYEVVITNAGFQTVTFRSINVTAGATAR